MILGTGILVILATWLMGGIAGGLILRPGARALSFQGRGFRSPGIIEALGWAAGAIVLFGAVVALLFQSMVDELGAWDQMGWPGLTVVGIALAGACAVAAAGASSPKAESTFLLTPSAVRSQQAALPWWAAAMACAAVLVTLLGDPLAAAAWLNDRLIIVVGAAGVYGWIYTRRLRIPADPDPKHVADAFVLMEADRVLRAAADAAERGHSEAAPSPEKLRGATVLLGSIRGTSSDAFEVASSLFVLQAPLQEALQDSVSIHPAAHALEQELETDRPDALVSPSSGSGGTPAS